MGTESVWDEEKVLGMDSGDGNTRLWMYLMPWVVHLKNGENDKHYVILYKYWRPVQEFMYG